MIARGRNTEEAARFAEVRANVLINRIEELGLKVAVEKTEAMVFRKKKGSLVIQLDIGGKEISTKLSMKYLGVIIDGEWNMRDHFKYVMEKSRTIINNIGRLMPNLGGPRESRRRFYNYVVHSVILYPAPVWAEELLTKAATKELQLLWNSKNRLA